MRGTMRNALVSPTAARDDAHTCEFYGKGVSTLCVLTCLTRTLPWPGARTDVARSSAARCCSLGGSKVPESASLECASPHQGSLFARFARALRAPRVASDPEATPRLPRSARRVRARAKCTPSGGLEVLGGQRKDGVVLPPTGSWSRWCCQYRPGGYSLHTNWLLPRSGTPSRSCSCCGGCSCTPCRRAV